MAHRVLPADIREILDTELSDASLRAFISAANMTINRILLNSTYTEDELFEIERWLSAHFAVSREKPVSSESALGASESYSISVAMGLDGSFYGQQVKILETEGILAGRERRRAQVSWIG